MQSHELVLPGLSPSPELGNKTVTGPICRSENFSVVSSSSASIEYTQGIQLRLMPWGCQADFTDVSISSIFKKEKKPGKSGNDSFISAVGGMTFITVKSVQISLTNTRKECSVDRWVVFKRSLLKQKKKKKGRDRLWGLQSVLSSGRSSMAAGKCCGCRTGAAVWLGLHLPSGQGKLYGIDKVWPLRSLISWAGHEQLGRYTSNPIFN